MRWFRCILPEYSLSFPVVLVISLLAFQSGTISDSDTTQQWFLFLKYSATAYTGSKIKVTSAEVVTSFPAQSSANLKDSKQEHQTGSVAYDHVIPHSFSTSGEFPNVTDENSRGNGIPETTSGINKETTVTVSPYTRIQTGSIARDRMKAKVSSHAKINNDTQRDREPAPRHLRRGEPADQRKDRQKFDAYLGDGYDESTDFDDNHSYRDLKIGSDDYGTLDDTSDPVRYILPREDLFREYEDLQYGAQPPPLHSNYSDLSLAKVKESWSRENRIEYEDLYDSHLIQDIPEESSVIRRIVSLRGKLSSDKINISLIVIYGWLALVLLAIITALLILKYKQKLSAECSRISSIMRLGGDAKGTSGFEEGNNLLAHPLV